MMETEVHVYAFSMAANVLLSLYPFLIVMAWICHYVLRWPTAEGAIYLAVRDYFPGPVSEWIQRNLPLHISRHREMQFFSVIMLLFTANGVFEPLEVALNKAWGFAANRTFVRNQLVSMGLIFLCGSLAFASMSFTALNEEVMMRLGFSRESVFTWIGPMVFKMAAAPFSMVGLFLVYWLLPNGKVPATKLIPVSIGVGAMLEMLKYISLVVGPALSTKLDREYGIFERPVTIILWSFLASMIVLIGAEWAARNAQAQNPVE
jgi:uncharacterized BrkB/YihY/UPF0761 family membrane protein